MSQRILRFVAVAAACLASGGCEILSAPGGAGIAGHGPLLAGYQVLAYDWSSDSRTIYFTAATGDQNRQSGLWRVDASSGRVTTLASTLPGNSGMAQTLRAVDPGGGQEKVYVALSQDTWCSPGTIFRVAANGGKSDTLATDVDNAAFVASHDGSRVAFTAVVFPRPGDLCPAGRDSFVVMATASNPAYGRRVVERGLSSFQFQPLSLSASGSLVYLHGLTVGNVTYTAIDLAPANGGATRELIRIRQYTGDTVQVLSQDIVWRGETPTLLLTRTVQGRSGVDVYTIDGESGLQTPQASVPDAIAPTSLSQSADGTAWAGWFVVEDLTPKNIERHDLRYRLYAKTPDQSSVRVLAEVESYEGPWKLRVSPDGRRVSFLNRELYVIPLQ